jgi:signal transduction histidine kinase
VRGQPRVEHEVGELADICHEAYGDVREAILGLRESSRPDRTLLESLRAYVDKLERQSGIRTTLDSTIDGGLILAPRCEVQVIRVVQESLTNVRKHSGARSVAVRVTATDTRATFVVTDDGCGFVPGAVPTDRDGFGLASMRERMRLVNGGLVIDSAPGRGTRIIVDVPGALQATSHPFEAVE